MSKLALHTNKAWINSLGLPGFKRYFANTSWLMAEKIFRMAVTLSVGVYVVRYLGPERFGVLTLCNECGRLVFRIIVAGLKWHSC